MAKRAAPLASLALLLGCQSDPVIPKIAAAPIALTMIVSSQTLQPGQADTIRLTTTNKTSTTVRLRFPTQCAAMVTVRNAAGTLIATGSNVPCLPVSTNVTIAPSGTSTQTIVWNRGFAFSPPDTPSKVPAGIYFVVATLNAESVLIPQGDTGPYSTFAPAYRIEVK